MVTSAALTQGVKSMDMQTGPPTHHNHDEMARFLFEVLIKPSVKASWVLLLKLPELVLNGELNQPVAPVAEKVHHLGNALGWYMRRKHTKAQTTQPTQQGVSSSLPHWQSVANSSPFEP